jgi:preprotein translocase subunit SecA
VEAKEGVEIERETQTLATITIQNYFRMYEKLAGMTGTAATEAQEFEHTYKMTVMSIPTNRPVRRGDYDDLIYKTRREKYNAVIDEIQRLHEAGLPSLVGTISVEVSELLSRMLKRKGISHNVLNAKNHASEAQIVKDAGQPGMVTIATNMAGRGTDIKLGKGVVKCAGACCLNCSEECKTYPPCTGKKTRTDFTECANDVPCGLHIIGTERHESRRIDNQLRGRAGRQGDPGASVFFLSLEDDLMRLFGSEKITGILSRLGMQDGEPIHHSWVTKAIGGAQKRIENMNFERRKKTLEYDDVLNKQRTAIYDLRKEVLSSKGEDLRQVFLNVCYEGLMAKFTNEYGDPRQPMTEWDIEGFFNWIRRFVPFIDFNKIEVHEKVSVEELIESLMPEIKKAYLLKEELHDEEINESFGGRTYRILDARNQKSILA